MEGFRHAYDLPKTWGLLKERLIAFSLVILAGIPMTFSTIMVAFGSRIETRILFHMDDEFGPLRAADVDDHPLADCDPDEYRGHCVDLSQRRAPHAALAQRAARCHVATAMWFWFDALFGWYLQRFADYSIIYGSLGVGIALLVWMYMISLIILVGAEFNAMLFPRCAGQSGPPGNRG